MERSSGLLGPAQRRRESLAFWVTAAVIAAVALAAYYVRIG